MLRNSLILLTSLIFFNDQAVLGQGNDDLSSTIVQIHGSGSSATQRCFWHVMETLGGQTKITTRGTYRSVGSGAGVREFMGNITHPQNYFGSSDYPLPKENFDTLTNAGAEMVHLPVVMGAVAVFHSLPLVKQDDATKLNLTSCLIARMYKGEITDWMHPDILEINPSFELPEQLDFYGNPVKDPSFPIKVAHRSGASGTTNTFTSYLHKACPEHWGGDLFGSDIEWPMAGGDSLIPTGGTSGMINVLSSGEEGVIGYSDAGSALATGLDEAALKVEESSLKGDFFLTAENALTKNGVAAALGATNIPESGDVDWSGVDTVNNVEGYVYAWPMSALTYVYVRKDLTTIPDLRAQSFLKAFLRSMYDDKYVGKCEEDFGFLAIKDELRDLAMQSIDMLQLSPNAPEWIQESSVLPNGAGQGDFVISTRRAISTTMEQDFLKDKVGRVESSLQETLELVGVLKGNSEDMAVQVGLATMESDLEDNPLFESLGKRVDSSFIMASVAIVLCFLLALLIICRQEGRLRKLESLPSPMLQEQGRKKKRRIRDEEDSY